MLNNNNQKDEIIEEGLKKGIIKIKEDKIIYPNGKSYNFKDPEEKVRAKVFIELVEKYKYPEKRLDTEVTGPRREPKLPADIVVYEDDGKETAFIVVETKAESTKNDIDEAKREGLGNVNLLNSKYLLVVCASERMTYNLEKHPSTVDKLEKYRVADIPVKYGKEPKFRFKRGDKDNKLRKVTFNELSNKFQLCHDEIWEGGKRDPAVAFDEISKLLITKLYDERFTPAGEYYKFQIGTFEEPKDIAKRIREIYETVQKKNSEVFKAKLGLPDVMISRIVEHLQDISLRTTDLDVKGRAFENFLGKLFRGEYGQYFTPRQIVEFMVEVIDPDEDDYLIDPACGSGGFLLYSMRHILGKVTEKYTEDKETIDRLNWDFSHKQIFGIEINDRIARVAMMDMVIHEDGHSNIECNDALINYKNFDPRKDIKPNKYDILLTNPPFGAVIKEEEILKKYKLGEKKTQRTEILFIERCLDLLKENGRMGIVLPDGVLTNNTLNYVRDFIKEKAKILAIVQLPIQTFIPAGAGVKASLVFLQKKKSNEKIKSYPIFMTIVEHVGYDATGRPDANDLPKILELWLKFKDNQKPNEDYCFSIDFEELESRFDPYYYRQEFRQIKNLEKSKWNILKLDELIEKINYGASVKAYPKGEVSFLRIQNLQKNKLKLDNLIYAKKSELIDSNYVQEGDFLISRSGTIGVVARVPKEADKFAFGSFMIRFRLKDDKNINPEYISLFLNSRLGKLQTTRSKTGGLQGNITIPAIKNIKIPIPPIRIQDETVKILNEATKEVEKLNKKIKNILSDSIEKIESILAEK